MLNNWIRPSTIQHTSNTYMIQYKLWSDLETRISFQLSRYTESTPKGHTPLKGKVQLKPDRVNQKAEARDFLSASNEITRAVSAYTVRTHGKGLVSLANSYQGKGDVHRSNDEPIFDFSGPLRNFMIQLVIRVDMFSYLTPTDNRILKTRETFTKAKQKLGKSDRRKCTNKCGDQQPIHLASS